MASASRQELEFIQVTSWKPVTGYEGLYEVSSCGRVRSLGFQTPAGYRKGRVLKPSVSDSGYSLVTLARDGSRKSAHVHRLVCEAFNGPQPSSLHEVAHNDGDAQNNAASNLRWDTRSGNQHDKIAHGTLACGDRHGMVVLPDHLIPIIMDEYVKGSSTHGLKALAKKYGVSIYPIYRIVKGIRKTAGGG